MSTKIPPGWGKKHQQPPPPTYTLDFEFDTMPPQLVPQYGVDDTGDRLDTDMQAPVTIAQSSVSGGILTLKCERKTTPSGRPYAGATWSTYGTFAQKYGTFETRMRYDEANGTWPSWFFLPQGSKSPFPEIDAIEAYGSTACLGPGATEHVSYGAGGAPSAYTVVVLPDSSGWHTYKFTWTATRMEFFIDGVSSWVLTDVTKIPQVAMYPIYTWGVGANNADCRIDVPAPTPDLLTMQIDYLRIKV